MEGKKIEPGGLSRNPFAVELAEPQAIEWLKEVLQSNPERQEPVTNEEPWIMVAPDYYVKKSEYQRRFGEVDLEYYRRQMSRKLFTAFVRHMGVVPGSPGLDVVELTTLPDL